MQARRQKQYLLKKLEKTKTTIKVAGTEYKYKAFSLLGDRIKIYTGKEEIILPIN